MATGKSKKNNNKKTSNKKKVAGKKKDVTKTPLIVPEPIIVKEEKINVKEDDMSELIVPQPDDISTVEEIKLREDALSLKKDISTSYWQLSKKLFAINKGEVFKKWGFQGLGEYVTEELDFELRKARYFIAIQVWCGSFPEEIQKRIEALGWTKTTMLINTFDAKNADEFLKLIDGMSTRNLKSFLTSRDKLGSGGGEGGGEGSSGENSGVRNSGIEHGETESTKTFKKTFSLFGAQHDNVNNALRKASEVSESEKEGHNIDLICTDFLSSTVGVTGINAYLAKVEETLGVKLMAFDLSKKMIVFGTETFGTVADLVASDELMFLEEISEEDPEVDNGFEDPEKE